jgi:hypothetical protein
MGTIDAGKADSTGFMPRPLRSVGTDTPRTGGHFSLGQTLVP